MAVLKVKNKQGKVVRTVDSKTGRTLKKFDKKGKVTSDFTKPKKKKSSGRKSRSLADLIKGNAAQIVAEVKQQQKKRSRSKSLADLIKQNAAQIVKSTQESIKKSGGAAKLKEQQQFKRTVERARLGQLKQGDISSLARQGVQSRTLTDISRLNQQSAIKGKENQDVNKLFNSLSRTRFVDEVSKIQAFKIGANQIIKQEGGQPLPASADVKLFEDKLKIIQKTKSSTSKQAIKTTDKNIFNQQNSIENRVITGQTVSPQEFKQFQQNFKKTNKALTKSQLNKLSNVVVAPVNYGKNLVLRNRAGERNPFAKDIKSFAGGVKKTTVDIVTDLVALGWKGVKFSVSSAYNYGTRITKEAQKGNFVLDDDLKKVIIPIFKGAKTTAQITTKAIKFTKDNPLAAAMIVGSATASGVSVVGNTGKKIAKLTSKSYKKNPADFLGQVAGFFLGGAILRGVGTGVSTISKSKILRSVLHSQKFSSNKFVVKTNLVTGVSKISGKTKGTFLNGKKFTTQYRLTVDTKTKKVTGQLRTTVGKKTTLEQVNLIDKPGFYLNPKTGVKVPKLLTGIKSRSITLKQTTLKPIKGSEKTIVQNGVVASVKDADFTSVITRIINNTKKITKRTGTIRLSTATQNDITKIKNFASQFTKQVGKVKRTTQSKPLTNVEIKRLKNFINTVGLENLKGLDRRIKIAKVLGVTKTNKIIKPLENILNKFGQVEKVKITKGTAVLKGEIIKLAKPTPKFRFKLKTRKLSDLRKSKKAQISLVQNNKVELLNKKGKSFKIKQIIEIPALKSTVPLTIPVLKKLGIFSKMTNVFRILVILNKVSTSLKPVSISPKKINSLVLSLRKNILQINKTIQTSELIKTPTTPTTVKSGKTISRITLKRLSPPVLKKTSPTKPLKRIPLEKIALDSKLPSGQRLSFGIRFREKKFTSKPFNKKSNPVITKMKKLGLPLNKAIKKGFGATDKTTQRSAELFIQGITKTKDIESQKSLMKKFNISKTKKTLRFVEKSRFSIDTSGEKRGLSISRALAPKKRKKSVKTKQSVKKNKKVSNSSNKKKKR